MKKVLILALLFIAISGYAQIEIDFKYGRIEGRNIKNLYKSDYSDGALVELTSIYGIGSKYHFGNGFYTGLQVDWYKMMTRDYTKLEIMDSRFATDASYINTLISFSSIARNRINTSLYAGYEVKHGLYLEMGTTLMRNYNNRLDGSRYDRFIGDVNNISTDLSTLDLNATYNIAFFAGIGWKFKVKKGFCFLIDYKYSIEQATKFETDSDFAYQFHTSGVAVGIGYYLDYSSTADGK